MYAGYAASRGAQDSTKSGDCWSFSSVLHARATTQLARIATPPRDSPRVHPIDTVDLSIGWRVAALAPNERNGRNGG